MDPKINVSIALILVLTFLSLHGCYSNHLLEQPRANTAPVTTPPDFAKIQDVHERKQAFFQNLRPMIEQENARIASLRAYIQQQDMQRPSGQLRQLSAQYRIKANADDLKRQLLEKVDTLPASLVLAQAAIESAWGTSRFATQGNNLFGQWCFTPGCGIVPAQRPAGAHHEVKRFRSPADSIQSYMLNLNSHPAYALLRQNRAAQRQDNAPLNGCFLAEGLVDYSELREQYIASLKQLMRVNTLEDARSPYCKKPAPAIVTAQQAPSPSAAKD